MLRDKYGDLPNSLEPEQVQRKFDELLRESDECERDGNLDVVDVMEALYELADRQWHTYTVLPVGYKVKIEHWIHEHWQPSSSAFVACLGMIAGGLGLIEVLELCASECNNSTLDDEVRKELREIVTEIGPHIDDPYHSLRKGITGESTS